MTPAQHRHAAEHQLDAAWDTDSLRPLLRALVHAVLAHLPEETP